VQVIRNRNSDENEPENLTESLGELLRQMTELLRPGRAPVVTTGGKHAYCWLLFFDEGIRPSLRATEQAILSYPQLKELAKNYKFYLSQRKIAIEFSKASTFHVTESGEHLRRPEEWLQYFASPNYPLGKLETVTFGAKKGKGKQPQGKPVAKMLAGAALAGVQKMVRAELAKAGPPVSKAKVSRTTQAKTKTAKGVFTVTHSENFMVVPYATNFTLQKALLTPAEMPFLSTFSAAYEEYRFTSAKLRFLTFAPTNTAGSLALAITYGNSKDETSMTEMKDHSGTVEGPVWDGIGNAISVNFQPSRASRKWYFTNPTDTPPNGNNAGVVGGFADYSPATVKCAVEGNGTAGSTMGYIVVDYTCEFTSPRSPAQDDNKDPAAITWTGVFGVISKLIDVFGPALLAILSVDAPTDEAAAGKRVVDLNTEIDQDTKDKMAIVNRLGKRGLLLGGMSSDNATIVLENVGKLEKILEAQDATKKDADEKSRLSDVVERVVAERLAAIRDEDDEARIEKLVSERLAARETDEEARIKEIVQKVMAANLEAKVGTGDGYCYLHLFAEESQDAVKARLGANPTWQKVIDAAVDFPLSGKLLHAFPTAEDTWHIEEHVGGKLPHTVLDIVKAFGPFLLQVVGMPYRGYNNKVVLAGVNPWIEVTQLATTLREVSGMPFGVKATRDNIRKKFDGMTSNAPFSVSERFPETGLYVYQGAGDWHGKFTRIFESLDTSAEPAGAQPAGRDARNAPSSYDDASHSYYKTLETMNMQMLAGDGVFGRKEFESHFGLRWEMTMMRDLVPHLASVFQASEVRFNPGNVAAMNWPGIANTALLEEVAADLRINTGSRVVLFSDNRVGEHRARTIMMVQSDGTLAGFLHDVVQTAN